MKGRLIVSSLCSWYAMTATTTPSSGNSDKNLYNSEAYHKPEAKPRPFNEIDHRSRGGPKLTYLWNPNPDEALVGQTLYLGGEVGR